MKSPFGDMEGWKTKSTTIAGTLTGLGMIVTAFVSDFVNIELLFAGIGTILAAFGLTGLGHKADKLKKAIIAYDGAKKPDDSGNAKLKLITIIFSLFLVFSLIGCSTFDKIWPRPKEPVCDREEAKNSLICEYSRKIGIEPEQYEDVVLDTLAVAMIVEPEKMKAVRHFVDRTKDLMKANILLTPAQMFTWVQKNQDQSKAIANIVSRRLPWMENVNDLFDPFDIWLIEEHLKHIEELL